MAEPFVSGDASPVDMIARIICESPYGKMNMADRTHEDCHQVAETVLEGIWNNWKPTDDDVRIFMASIGAASLSDKSPEEKAFTLMRSALRIFAMKE